MKLPSLKRLDSRGAGHLLLPLVVVMALAVGGTYMMVASHANPATNLAAAKVTKTPKYKPVTGKKGYLVIYSEQGSYAKAKITLTKNPGSTEYYTCAGINKNKTETTVGLTKSRKQLPCTSTHDVAKYNVSFAKDRKSNGYGPVQGVDVDAGYCTLVYPDPTKSVKVAQTNGKCPTAPDNVTKQDVSMRTLLTVSKNKKAIGSTYIEVKPVNGASKQMCTGSLKLTVTREDGAVAKSTPSYPLKFVGSNANGAAYCTAHFSTLTAGNFVKPGHTYTVTAYFPGNVYLNGGSSTSSIAIPAAAPKKTSTKATVHNTTGGVQAPSN